MEELLQLLEVGRLTVADFTSDARKIIRLEIMPLEDRMMREASREYIEDLHRLDNAGD